MYEFTGTVIKVNNTQSYGQKGFRKRTLIIREASDGKYPNLVPFMLRGDKCDLADSIKPNSRVKVSFVLSGHSWDKQDGSEIRYFCDNVILRIDLLEEGKPAPAPSEDDISYSDEDVPF